MLQGEFELPSRLSVSAADCLLALTVSLVRKDAVTSNGHKSSASSASKQRVALVTTASADKKATSAHKPVELSNSETETLLWSHLEALIHLVQKLLAVSFFCWFLSLLPYVVLISFYVICFLLHSMLTWSLFFEGKSCITKRRKIYLYILKRHFLQERFIWSYGITILVLSTAVEQ